MAQTQTAFIPGSENPQPVPEGNQPYADTLSVDIPNLFALIKLETAPSLEPIGSAKSPKLFSLRTQVDISPGYRGHEKLRDDASVIKRALFAAYEITEFSQPESSTQKLANRLLRSARHPSFRYEQAGRAGTPLTHELGELALLMPDEESATPFAVVSSTEAFQRMVDTSKLQELGANRKIILQAKQAVANLAVIMALSDEVAAAGLI